jgi:HK97 family phage prohead protease
MMPGSRELSERAVVHRVLAGGSLEPLGEREVGVIAATSSLARDGHVLEVSGIALSNYRKVPIVLYQHNPAEPVGTCTAIGVEGDVLAARIEFAAAGISVLADQCCAMVKAGILRGISVGFDPDMSAAEPLDRNRPRGGMRFNKSELLELSIVSIPADPGATVVARSFSSRADFRKLIERLPPVGVASIARAAAIVPRHSPSRILSHAGHVWTLLEMERQKEQRFSREARLEELRQRRNPSWKH